VFRQNHGRAICQQSRDRCPLLHSEALELFHVLFGEHDTDLPRDRRRRLSFYGWGRHSDTPCSKKRSPPTQIHGNGPDEPRQDENVTIKKIRAYFATLPYRSRAKTPTTQELIDYHHFRVNVLGDSRLAVLRATVV
jgi:hypothetical protein